MKNFPGAALILLAASLAGFVAAVVIRGVPAPREQYRIKPKIADWDSYQYKSAGATAGRQFNIKIVMENGPGGPSSVRLVFNQQDQANYYFVEFGERTRIAEVQNGIEIP
ncbi:MAG: hypothetical protein QF886_09355, partial [Planctomycetota bacterium]|nr:hypothetical protein [Planctomycetota bacterium]